MYHSREERLEEAPMSRLTRCVLSALILTLAVALPSSGADTSAIDSHVANAWWQDPGISEALSLTPALRAKMDGVMRANLEKRLEIRSASREKSKAFNEALETGEWAAARKAAESLADASADQDRMRSNLKIDILSVLSKDQLATLTADHGQVIRRPWVRQAKDKRTRGANRNRAPRTQKQQK